MRVLAIATGLASLACGQSFDQIRTPSSPLMLEAQGSFFVGGESVAQSAEELGGFGPAGHITVNQMYVRFMIPQGGGNKASVVMIHGMTLTGKTWETTPDGRMGWDEYFVRKGHAVYVPDQVSRGRSGFNQSVYNRSAAPATQKPRMLRLSDEVAWPNFRFGTKEGSPYPDAQFPVSAVDQLSKQATPDLSGTVPRPNPTHGALAELASKLKQTVLISHSQSGSFPLAAALIDPAGIVGMVLIEPGACPAAYTRDQIIALSRIPTLVVFGDHLGDTPTGIPGFSWQTAFDGCQAFIERVKEAGGNAEMLHLPAKDIHGNSHLLMQDNNNLEIAGWILQWIETNAGKRKESHGTH